MTTINDAFINALLADASYVNDLVNAGGGNDIVAGYQGDAGSDFIKGDGGCGRSRQFGPSLVRDDFMTPASKKTSRPKAEGCQK